MFQHRLDAGLNIVLDAEVLGAEIDELHGWVSQSGRVTLIGGGREEEVIEIEIAHPYATS